MEVQTYFKTEKEYLVHDRVGGVDREGPIELCFSHAVRRAMHGEEVHVVSDLMEYGQEHYLWCVDCQMEKPEIEQYYWIVGEEKAPVNPFHQNDAEKCASCYYERGISIACSGCRGNSDWVPKIGIPNPIQPTIIPYGYQRSEGGGSPSSLMVQIPFDVSRSAIREVLSAIERVLKDRTGRYIQMGKNEKCAQCYYGMENQDFRICHICVDGSQHRIIRDTDD